VHGNVLKTRHRRLTITANTGSGVWKIGGQWKTGRPGGGKSGLVQPTSYAISIFNFQRASNCQGVRDRRADRPDGHTDPHLVPTLGEKLHLSWGFIQRKFKNSEQGYHVPKNG